MYDRPCNSSSAALPSLDESGADAGPPREFRVSLRSSLRRLLTSQLSLLTAPSMFGRDLTEQAEADGESIPVIVRKCIAAVDAVGMEYEGEDAFFLLFLPSSLSKLTLIPLVTLSGIYRKTGGSSSSKHITQLFERGDYDAFDLSDQDT